MAAPVVVKVSGIPLAGLFDRFARAGLAPCVMRGYEHLPDTVENDLDLMVAPGDVPLFRSILLDFALSEKLELVAVADHFHVVLVRFLGVDHAGAIRRLIVDEHTRGEGWWGIPYLSNEAVLRDAVSKGPFLVPRPAHEGAMALLGHLLIGKTVKDKHLARLPDLISTDSIEFERVMTAAFGSRLSRQVMEGALQKEGRELEDIVWQLRIAHLSRGLSTEPSLIGHLIRDRTAQLRLKLARRGVVVQFDSSDPEVKAAEVARATKLIFKDAWFVGDSLRQAPGLAGYGRWYSDRSDGNRYRIQSGILRERIVFIGPETDSARYGHLVRGSNDAVATIRSLIVSLSKRSECALLRCTGPSREH